MKKIIVFVIVAIGALSSCSSDSSVEQNGVVTKNVTVTEFQSLSKSKSGIILDVRTPEEVVTGVIAGAVHIDIYDSDFLNKVGELDKSKPVFVYCKAGGRSSEAMGEMKKLGFTEIYNLDGGITAWDEAGMKKQSN